MQPAEPPEIYEMALGRPATASSIWGSGVPSKGNDGNFNNIFHTQCGDAGGPWWQVDLGVDSFVQDVFIKNRPDCCGGRLKNADVELLDGDGNVVESKRIVGSVGNGQTLQKVFNEHTSIGRYVRVKMGGDCLHFAEIQVNGYHLMAHPTSSPTPTLSNLSIGKPASQSSTYTASMGPEKAVDGIDETSTHTHCWKGINQWWEVDLEDVYTIATLKMVNRLACCGGRLHDFTISFLDENKELVDSIFNSGQMGNRKTYDVGTLIVHSTTP